MHHTYETLATSSIYRTSHIFLGEFSSHMIRIYLHLFQVFPSPYHTLLNLHFIEQEVNCVDEIRICCGKTVNNWLINNQSGLLEYFIVTFIRMTSKQFYVAHVQFGHHCFNAIRQMFIINKRKL